MSLIKYHYSNDRGKFDATLKIISDEFMNEGNKMIAAQIKNLINNNAPVNKNIVMIDSKAPKLILPEALEIEKEIIVKRKKNFPDRPLKILFYGHPGTGKTEMAKTISYELKLKLHIVNFNEIISSFLGETSKNIKSFFDSFDFNSSILFLDEVDGLISDRNNVKSEEIYRATIEFMKSLDSLPINSLVIAATNLFSSIDQAITRRFDTIVNFDKYTKSNLDDVFNYYINYFEIKTKKSALNCMIKKMNKFNSPDNIRKFLEKIEISEKLEIHDKLIYSMKENKNDKEFLFFLKECGFTTKFISDVFNKNEKTIRRWLSEAKVNE